MIRFAVFFLLLCRCCLLSPPATAQVVSAEPVQLVPGDVVRDRLIGVDSATYQMYRRAVALVAAGDAVQADLHRDVALAKEQAAESKAELLRYKQQDRENAADFQVAAAEGQKAVSRPRGRSLLLDGNTYKGVGFGLILREVVQVGIKLFVHL